MLAQGRLAGEERARHRLIDDGGVGGGIACGGSPSPTITNNVIAGNTAYEGGGIGCFSCSPMIANNSITGNMAPSDGGGIYCYNSSPTIANNTIAGNSVFGDSVNGGGVYCTSSSPVIREQSRVILIGFALSFGPILIWMLFFWCASVNPFLEDG